MIETFWVGLFIIAYRQRPTFDLLSKMKCIKRFQKDFIYHLNRDVRVLEKESLDASEKIHSGFSYCTLNWIFYVEFHSSIETSSYYSKKSLFLQTKTEKYVTVARNFKNFFSFLAVIKFKCHFNCLQSTERSFMKTRWGEKQFYVSSLTSFT